MKSLWAPWRMEFITAAHQGSGKCLFCRLSAAPKSLSSLVICQGKKAFVVLNRYPYLNGHLLVVPRRHLADMSKLKKEEHVELGRLVSRSLVALKKALSPQGFNVGLNLGRAAGAGIEDHLHYHVVPRWIGDSNFMPVIGETRVLPEFITDTYKKLVKYF